MVQNIALGFAVLLAIGIMLIGTQYIVSQTAATKMFGLPLPEGGANTVWWIRLKGVRDITSGIAVLTMLIWGTHPHVGLVLLAESCIPVGDMLMILGAKGSTSKAYGMHGGTAVVMVLTGIALVTGMQ